MSLKCNLYVAYFRKTLRKILSFDVTFLFKISHVYKSFNPYFLNQNK